MPDNRPLYKGSESASFDRRSSNSGLWYDKFCGIWQQNWTIREGTKLDWIKTVATKDAVGSSDQLKEHEARQQGLVNKLGGRALTLITATRFATGLGREHPVEIGFTWHHTLGTPYLPGSSVKGLLRAYVREWIGHETATELFGQEDFKKESRVGKWIFFDAVPTKPVQLEADVMTPHYKPYYQDAQGRTPPGDWHSPIPIPFLAVAREQSFQFAFAPRGNDSYKLPDGTPVTNDTIADWLRSALHWLGAGAKTNSGFGVFRDSDPAKAEAVGQERPRKGTPAEKSRRSFTATLELITPAFLAGADQNAPTDCDLRPATLRGQLRYWWRTMHAGYLTVEELRSLEAALWGSTNGAGAIRVVVEPERCLRAERFDFRDGYSIKPDFKKAHEIEVLPPPPPDQAPLTQGLFYAAYGMNDGGKQRHFLPPGATWKLRVIAKSCRLDRVEISPENVLAQAQSALALLCRYGGVGSKARKGFGSLAATNFDNVSDSQCELLANTLRRQIGQTREFVETEAQSPSLRQMLQLQPLKVSTPWKDCWFLLDQLGASFQAFAQAPESSGHGKHCESKMALGLPRQIHGPKREKMRHQERSGQHRRPVSLRGPMSDRHSSPIHYHIAPGSSGLTVHVAAFPTTLLPDMATSRRVLGQLLTHLKTDLSQRCLKHATKGQRSLATTTTNAVQANPSVSQAKRPSGTPVRVKLLRVREKGGFHVQEDGRPEGNLNLGPVPTPPPNVGDIVDVLIKDDAKPPQYQWKSPSTGATPSAAKSKKPGK